MQSNFLSPFPFRPAGARSLASSSSSSLPSSHSSASLDNEGSLAHSLLTNITPPATPSEVLVGDKVEGIHWDWQGRRIKLAHCSDTSKELNTATAFNPPTWSVQALAETSPARRRVRFVDTDDTGVALASATAAAPESPANGWVVEFEPHDGDVRMLGFQTHIHPLDGTPLYPRFFEHHAEVPSFDMSEEEECEFLATASGFGIPTTPSLGNTTYESSVWDESFSAELLASSTHPLIFVVPRSPNEPVVVSSPPMLALWDHISRERTPLADDLSQDFIDEVSQPDDVVRAASILSPSVPPRECPSRSLIGLGFQLPASSSMTSGDATFGSDNSAMVSTSAGVNRLSPNTLKSLQSMFAMLDTFERLYCSDSLESIYSAEQDPGVRSEPGDSMGLELTPSTLPLFLKPPTCYEGTRLPNQTSPATLGPLNALPSIASSVDCIPVFPQSPTADAYRPALPSTNPPGVTSENSVDPSEAEYPTLPKIPSHLDPRSPPTATSTRPVSPTVLPSEGSYLSLSALHPARPSPPKGAPKLASINIDTASPAPAPLASQDSPGLAHASSSTRDLKHSKSMEGLGLGLPTALFARPQANNTSHGNAEATFEPRMSTSEESADLVTLATGQATSCNRPAPITRRTRTTSFPNTNFLRVSKFVSRELYTIEEVATPTPLTSSSTGRFAASDTPRPISTPSTSPSPPTIVNPPRFDLSRLRRLSHGKEKHDLVSPTLSASGPPAGAGAPRGPSFFRDAARRLRSLCCC